MNGVNENTLSHIDGFATIEDKLHCLQGQQTAEPMAV